MLRVLILIFGVLGALCPGVARAQGAAAFLSPGPLTAGHADIVNCFSCHSPSRGVDHTLCLGCHDSVRNQVSTGIGFHGQKAERGKNCQSCHHEHRGRDFAIIPSALLSSSSFDHARETGWPLNGAHASAECIDCHTTPGKYTGLKSTCVSCHDEPHGADESKRDVLAACDRCHNEVEWKALPIPTHVFSHTTGADTDYLLTGKHLQVACASCHFDWRFVPVKHERCLDCHDDPHRANFGKDTCETCHPTPESWAVPKFNHDRTPYKLEGEHRGVDCYGCHKGNATVPLKYSTCEDCHADMHSGQFKPRPCEECHTVQVAAFALRNYDHDTTRFPLVGLHTGVMCEACHGDREEATYIGRPFDDCDACHVDEHQGRFEPTDCQRCHTAEGFKALFFNHDDTAFPHTGKHREVECNACHEDFKWVGFPFGSCADCHDEASPHQPGILGPETCDTCHNTTAFDVISFDHKANTRFDLAPQHTKHKCVQCHESVDKFAGVSSDCSVCHQTDRPWGHYEGNCGNCHQAEKWFPGGLGNQDHTVTGFPLRGQHARQDCESCHPPGRARGDASPNCVSCHAQDDSHKNLLGNQCDDCHSDFSWFRVRWRHGSTGWPLRGAHKLAECFDCHPSSYTGTPRDCARCHASEASPNAYHQTVAFQDCQLCHREYAWTPPILTGALP